MSHCTWLSRLPGREAHLLSQHLQPAALGGGAACSGSPKAVAPAVCSRAFIQQTFIEHLLMQDSDFEGREEEFSPPTDPVRISQDGGVGVGRRGLLVGEGSLKNNFLL